MPSNIVSKPQLSHLDESGAARMVDVSAKTETSREAVAEAWLLLSEPAWKAVVSGTVPKGDVIAVSRIAGIQAAKQTANLIPLCHPLPISGVTVEARLRPGPAAPTLGELAPGAPAIGSPLPSTLLAFAPTAAGALQFVATVRIVGRTGVEMEALLAAQLAATAAYDMLKAVDKSLVIAAVRLVAKSGGKSGDFRAGEL